MDDKKNDANTKILPRQEIYNPVTDRWTQEGTMASRRWGFSTSVVEGKIYVIGGTIGARITFPTVEAYQPGLADQSVDAEGKLTTEWGRLKAKTSTLRG